MDKSYKQELHKITTIILDVDGVLTNSLVTITTDGQLLRQMNIKDGYAMKTAVDAGLKICIISGGKNDGVKSRLQNLGIQDVYLGIHDKIEKFHEIKDAYQLNTDEILYMGDDLPDYPVMKLVGLPCCPQDAAPEIKAISKYISPKNGGDGCVRDVLEQILKIQGKWNTNFNARYD